MLPEGWSEPLAGVPVWRKNGASKQPHVLITAGIHGDEYEGPAAVVELVDLLARMAIQGTVTAIPVCNPMAWRAASRCSPDDGLNLARVFPGDSKGSATQRLAAALFSIASEASHLIDLHSGGSDYLFLPLAGFYGAESLAAAGRFGLPLLWRLPETAGVLSCEFHRQGKTAIGCEYLGGGLRSPEGVAAYRTGILSCLAHWGLLDATYLLPRGGEQITGDWILAGADGAFFPEVSLGDVVQPQQLLATLRGPRGEVLESAVANSSGRVLAIRRKAYIKSGDWAVLVAAPLSE